MIRLFLIFALTSLNFVSHSYAGVDKKVSLIIYLDFSSSMISKVHKVGRLVPIMAERLQRECGNYQIATSNIMYANHGFNQMVPYGIPAFITPETPRAVERITNRMMAPFGGNTLEMINLDGIYNVTSSTEEITYSSIVTSIEQNIDQLRDQDLVAALIVSDAAPAFEYETPESAIQKIRSLLPHSQFMAAAIAMKTFNGMPRALGPNCRPDITGTPNAGGYGDTDILSTQGWINPDLSSLETFTRRSGGWVWDICEDDYEATLQDFIQTMILNAGCSLMM